MQNTTAAQVSTAAGTGFRDSRDTFAGTAAAGTGSTRRAAGDDLAVLALGFAATARWF